MELGGLEETIRVASYEYDFAMEGGAVGDITMRGPRLPSGARVYDGIVEVMTAVTSGGAATVALKLESAADVLAATGKASLTAGALLDAKQDSTAANVIKVTTNGVQLKATVAAAALTAGKIVAKLFYVI